MKNYPKREKKKRGDKSKYCSFTGSVATNIKESTPKIKDVLKTKVKCPECGRKLIPDISCCTGGREDVDWACCVHFSLKRHRRKK